MALCSMVPRLRRRPVQDDPCRFLGAMRFGDDPDDDALLPDVPRQRLHLRLAAAIDALVALLGQKTEALKVAKTIIEDAVDLAGRLARVRDLPGRAMRAPRRRLNRAGIAAQPSNSPID